LERAPDYELWPEHAAAWRVFARCQTQWRVVSEMAVSMGGGYSRTRLLGLHYAGVETVMRRCGVSDAEADQVFEHVQILEDETLALRNKE
jgi:hypothetical protein